jgi:hypothetical protein
MVEADGSFKALDVPKFLAYMGEGTMVLGTRTTRQMVQQGANMRSILRWGNVTVAKLVELSWYVSSEPRLTDVGCTYRALTKPVWERIRPGLTETGPAFSPEMMCEVLRHRLRLIEIPVHYFAREGGESKHSASYPKIARTALMMLRAIARKRLESPVRDAAPSAAAGFARHPGADRRSANRSMGAQSSPRYVGVILSAGKGSRIDPFNAHYPKPLLPIVNKPILEHQIEQMKVLGIRDVILVVGT